MGFEGFSVLGFNQVLGFRGLGFFGRFCCNYRVLGLRVEGFRVLGV